LIDPAFGGWSEAKTTEDDRETFRRLREFRGLGQPILVSINRKNFLREVTGRSTEEALAVSLAATSMAIERGAHVVRTHDVRETVDAAAIGDTFTPARTTRENDVRVEELDVRTERDVARHAERLGIDDVAADATFFVLEVDGLTAEQVDRLATAAAGSGATFAMGESAGLLVGTARSLRGLATSDTDWDASGVVRDAIADVIA
jgi:dihydropteroate synthase